MEIGACRSSYAGVTTDQQVTEAHVFVCCVQVHPAAAEHRCGAHPRGAQGRPGRHAVAPGAGAAGLPPVTGTTQH